MEGSAGIASRRAAQSVVAVAEAHEAVISATASSVEALVKLCRCGDGTLEKVSDKTILMSDLLHESWNRVRIADDSCQYAVERAREAALWAEKARCFAANIDKEHCDREQKLKQGLSYAISQMQMLTKKLREKVSYVYTDEETVDGYEVFQFARCIDELADLLETSSLECQVTMDEVQSDVDDKPLWEEILAKQAACNLPPGPTDGEWRAENSLNSD